jgi:hypothetical protein
MGNTAHGPAVGKVMLCGAYICLSAVADVVSVTRERFTARCVVLSEVENVVVPIAARLLYTPVIRMVVFTTL